MHWCEAEQHIWEQTSAFIPLVGHRLFIAARERFKLPVAPARVPAGLTREATSPHQPSISS